MSSVEVGSQHRSTVQSGLPISVMLNLYIRMSSISSGGGAGQDHGYEYGVFGGPAMEAGVTIVMFCVLAASVVIWEACAFAAMAGLLLCAIWCLVPTNTRRSTSPDVPASAAEASVMGGGLTDTAIDEALPASPYGHHRVDDPADGGVTCSVCLEDVRGGEMVRSMPECRHLFHVGCIDVWLHSHPTCPLCRSDLSPRRRVKAAVLPSQLSPV